MHPVTTALFLLGYGLALPVGARLSVVVREQNRLALAGHQIGVIVALLGWGLRSSWAMVVLHGLWLVGARIWFRLSAARGLDRPRT